MDEIIKFRLNIYQLKTINACRLYLQVFYLSETTTPDGKTIKSKFLNGTKYNDSPSTSKWFSQPNPSKHAWKLWQKLLRKIFHIKKNNTLFPSFTTK